MEIFEISEYLEKIYIYLVISDRNIKNKVNYVLNFGFGIENIKKPLSQHDLSLQF